MRNLIVVAFIEPVAAGLVFPRDDWPLHITLVKFDVDPKSGTDARFDVNAESDADAAARVAAGPEDALAGRIAALIDQPVRAALGTSLTIGADAGFGRLESIPVSLVEASQPLQELHEAVMRTVDELQGRVPTPNYTLDNYRPHVSHHGDKRAQPGDVVVLDRVALVDMAPDGNHTVRRILRLWELRK